MSNAWAPNEYSVISITSCKKVSATPHIQLFVENKWKDVLEGQQMDSKLPEGIVLVLGYCRSSKANGTNQRSIHLQKELHRIKKFEDKYPVDTVLWKGHPRSHAKWKRHARGFLCYEWKLRLRSSSFYYIRAENDTEELESQQLDRFNRSAENSATLL